MDAVDLFNKMNASQISVQQCGQKEAFSRGHLKEEVVRRNPRWYLIGTPEERGINVQIETQRAVITAIQGTTLKLDVVVALHRKKYWCHFFDGKDSPFSKFDVPSLASQFWDKL